MFYTFEVFKKDARTKSGVRLINKLDKEFGSAIGAERYAQAMMDAQPSLEIEIYETYVTKKNLMTGEEFEERYDRPYYCSPSSETFWCS